MKDELQNYMDRPKRYDNIDGTGEMAFGLMALGYTFLNYLQAGLPEDSMWRHGFASMLLFFAVILLMFGLILWVPKAIKKRITWPRTGYVARRVGGKSWWTAMVGAAAFSAVIAAGVGCLMRFDRRHDWIRLSWMGAVAIYAAGYAFWIYRMERHHPWKWLVLLFMALGLLAIALIAPADFVGLWRPMLLFVGLTWLGSGGATLYLYIRHTQPPAPEAE
jgi:MFS family permease